MNIFIDPAYKAYYQNQLFNAQNKILNRDDTLAPFIRMYASLTAKDINVQTADYLVKNHNSDIKGDYYSFGLLDNIDLLLQRKDINFKAFVIFEPPVVAPHLYQSLPKLTQLFEKVYLHNVIGDGYSLTSVDSSRLRKLYWPQPYNTVVDKYWHKSERLDRIVVINGNHIPVSFNGELYSKRISVMSALHKVGYVDLYGRGWKKWWSRASMWLPYWINIRALMAVYKGPCDSKLEVLSQYNFSLCFENMYMQGYITEKIFDCFYAGTVPIYLGSKDISDLIPSNTYIDFRHFLTVADMVTYLKNISQYELMQYKEAARNFLHSKSGQFYYDSINTIVEENL